MDVSKERNTLLCLDTKHFFTFSHSICYRKQFQSILAKRNKYTLLQTYHSCYTTQCFKACWQSWGWKHSVRNSKNFTRNCQWDGMVLSERDEISQVFTVHKFTVKEVSASQRSAERPGSTKASDMGLGEEFVEPLHKVRAPRHHAETGIKQLLQALQVLLGHLKGDLLQTNGAVTHMQCYTKCKVTLSAMLH